MGSITISSTATSGVTGCRNNSSASFPFAPLEFSPVRLLFLQQRAKVITDRFMVVCDENMHDWVRVLSPIIRYSLHMLFNIG